jgi:methionyl-tRNA formyltransferase
MYRLFLQGLKGLEALKGFYSILGASQLVVVIGADKKIDNDYSIEIEAYCKKNRISVVSKNEDPSEMIFTIAVGWQRIINDVPNKKIIVFHDSILPRYRGFNPLVTALINGDKELGVSAILAETTYDTGPVLAQKTIAITYPLKISTAIIKIAEVYKMLSVEIASLLIKNNLNYVAQDMAQATYSLWRDEQDYFIDFEWSSERIKRHVDAVGSPYQGAQAYLNGEKVFIDEVEVATDVNIENRTPGKIIFLQESTPTVVCGEGLLKILLMRDSYGKSLKISRFRSRFK